MATKRPPASKAPKASKPKSKKAAAKAKSPAEAAGADGGAGASSPAATDHDDAPTEGTAPATVAVEPELRAPVARESANAAARNKAAASKKKPKAKSQGEVDDDAVLARAVPLHAAKPDRAPPLAEEPKAKVEARAKAEADATGATPRSSEHSGPGANDGSANRSAAESASASSSSSSSSTHSGASIPEIVVDEDDEDDEDEDQGLILDVGTAPSLPSMPSVDSRPSVPAIRAREGISRTGALERFLSEMGRYPLLNQKEEQELTLAYYERQDPIAARKLVVHNLRLVVKMAYKYRRAWANVLDLIQEGNVGLVEAVRRFDPFKGAKFSTYATFWIRAYMLRYLLEHSRMVRISRTRVGRKLFFRLSKEREKLRAQGIEPGPKLLAERLGVGESELEEVVKHMDQSEVRLDAPMYSDDQSGGTVLDGMSGELMSPEAQTYRREFEHEVSTALESFAQTLTDAREKMAWKEHLMAEDPVSLSELGSRFGVTKQRMGQIVAALRKRLKEHLIETLGPDVQLGFSLDAE